LASQVVPVGPLPFLGTLARSARIEDRLLWLRVAVDYFLSDTSPDAALRAEFETNFASCLAGADDESRLAVAKKLVSRGHAPPYLLAAIEALGGDAALFVLERAKGLPREKLLADAEERGLASAVARRDDLDDELVWTIVRGNSTEARVALVENPRAPLSAEQLLKLARRARADSESTGDRRLAEGLLARMPPRAEYAALFMEASSAQRTLILLAVQRAELGKPRGAPPGASSEAIAKLERFALTGESELFLDALAETLGCSLSLAEKIAADHSGELLAVTLAAIGTPNDVSVRILTSSDLRDGADYRRIGALARLQDALSPSAAQRVIAAIIENPQDRESPAPAQLELPTLPPRPPRPGPQPPIDRRPRATPVQSPREESVPAAVLRRRRAFAFLGAHRPLGDKV
jgi:uncharacterized protein (DUF2336 family)